MDSLLRDFKTAQEQKKTQDIVFEERRRVRETKAAEAKAKSVAAIEMITKCKQERWNARLKMWGSLPSKITDDPNFKPTNPLPKKPVQKKRLKRSKPRDGSQELVQKEVTETPRTQTAMLDHLRNGSSISFNEEGQ